MAYTPTTWVTGDDVTATKLNKIENGIANAGSAVIITETNETLDKTFAEIYDLVHSGTPCYIKRLNGEAEQDLDNSYAYNIQLMLIVAVYKYNDVYRIYASHAMGSVSQSSIYNIGSPAIVTYQVSSSDDYPTFLKTTHVPQSYVTINTNREV